MSCTRATTFWCPVKTRPPKAGTWPDGCFRSERWAKRIFADLSDRTGNIQLYVRKDEIGEDAFADWNDVERGDIVGVRGYVFRSKMGEITLHVTSFAVLSKSLLPLPDKWHGLVDVEKRYRQRYVDLIVSPDARDSAHRRAAKSSRKCGVSSTRTDFTKSKRRPCCTSPAARPRVRSRRIATRSTATMQLRIATELNLKRLIVGGLERVYEIGTNLSQRRHRHHA